MKTEMKIEMRMIKVIELLNLSIWTCEPHSVSGFKNMGFWTCESFHHIWTPPPPGSTGSHRFSNWKEKKKTIITKTIPLSSNRIKFLLMNLPKKILYLQEFWAAEVWKKNTSGQRIVPIFFPTIIYSTHSHYFPNFLWKSKKSNSEIQIANFYQTSSSKYKL